MSHPKIEADEDTRKFLVATSVAAALAAGSFLAVGPASAGRTAATLTVTKTVVGTPPPGATFVVNVLCVEEAPPGTTLPVIFSGGSSRASGLSETVYDDDVVFGPSGGSEEFIFFSEATCTVTEVDDGGADSSTGPVVVVIDSDARFTAEIVNTFDPDPKTTAAPIPAAEAVVAVPAFTG